MADGIFSLLLLYVVHGEQKKKDHLIPLSEDFRWLFASSITITAQLYMRHDSAHVLNLGFDRDLNDLPNYIAPPESKQSHLPTLSFV